MADLLELATIRARDPVILMIVDLVHFRVRFGVHILSAYYSVLRHVIHALRSALGTVSIEENAACLALHPVSAFLAMYDAQNS